VPSIGETTFHKPVLRGDLDAETAVFAGGLRLHVLEVFRVEIGRVRVERGEHAVDRGFHGLVGVELGDVVGLGFRQNVSEQVELLGDFGLLGGLVRRDGKRRNANGRCQQACSASRANRHLRMLALLLCHPSDVRAHFDAICAKFNMPLRRASNFPHHLAVCRRVARRRVNGASPAKFPDQQADLASLLRDKVQEMASFRLPFGR